jgi:hypothetical protein
MNKIGKRHIDYMACAAWRVSHPTQTTRKSSVLPIRDGDRERQVRFADSPFEALTLEA